MRRLLIGCLLLLTTNAFAADVLPFKATEKTLKNGLKVIVVPTGFPNIVSLQIPVQVGSRDEVEPGKTGFAHFFEHMMFRGTKKYPNEKYEAVIAEVGGRQNAYTTDDYTNYHITFSKDDLEKILELEADRFQNLDYSPEGFKTEARAVLGEYNKNSSNPMNKLEEVLVDQAFTIHPYKHTTMGFLKDIEDMPNQLEYSKGFFQRFYRPEYTTVVIAGDVEPQKAIALVEKYWGNWKTGDFVAKIPKEPEPKAPAIAHVPWPTETLPLVTVGFHGAAFSTTEKNYAALDLLVDLYFGQTSDLYKRLVEREQKVDELFAYNPGTVDPSLLVAMARLKDGKDAVYVRDELLRTFAQARTELVDPVRLAAAKSNLRYGFSRRLDSTESIASTLAGFVRYDRSYGTLNEMFRAYGPLTPQDLQAAAKKYFTDERLVQGTLSKAPLPAGIETPPKLATLVPKAPSGPPLAILAQESVLPVIDIKLLFTVGSAFDPAGKEGLAALSAAMLTNAGSKALRIDEINRALYPIAGSFSAQVDKEMTTLTMTVHKDKWAPFADIAWPMLLDPGFREEDFTRLRDAQLNALVQDLRTSNDEELGKERLQEKVFAGTPYGHPVLGTVQGLKAISLKDVQDFVAKRFVRENLRLGMAGDLEPAIIERTQRELQKLPSAPPANPTAIAVKAQPGRRVDILEKETRATAISFGQPLSIRRGDPDFVALYLARTWLGEHRSSMSHLYQRIREERGMNYGDYAYIEAFPRGMYQFFPDPNLGRRQQLFEIWIRPVPPESAQMALRIAIHELEQLVDKGLTQEAFERTRKYLMKNVFVMTAKQDDQLGYAMDSAWYGIPEYTQYMRQGLEKLTLADVNAALKKYIDPQNLQIVMVTKDAKGLKAALLADKPSTMKYDAEKPQALLDEDAVLGKKKLGIKDVTVTPIEQVFAK